MTASRTSNTAAVIAPETACPPRRSFVAGDARRRGQACIDIPRDITAFGAALPTPALRAGVDNARRFIVIVDD